VSDADKLSIPGSSRDWTAEDRVIMDTIKARVGDKTIGAQYRLDDHQDFKLMRAMTVFNS
jgi:hypothetical protein